MYDNDLLKVIQILLMISIAIVLTIITLDVIDSSLLSSAEMLSLQQQRRHQMLLATGDSTYSKSNSNAALNQYASNMTFVSLKADPIDLATGTVKIKKEYCSINKINQTITVPGCEPKIVENAFCYGQCNSIYMPVNIQLTKESAFPSKKRLNKKKLRNKKNTIKEYYKYCKSCFPSNVKKVNVTFQCGNILMSKKIEIITECSCIPCKKNSNKN